MKKIILNLRQRKFIFFEKKKYDVLILGKNFENHCFENLFSYRFIDNYLFVDCFIISIIKSLLTLKFNTYYFSKNYLKQLVKKFKSKVIISDEFKKVIFDLEDKNLKTIVYQIADHIDLHSRILKGILINSRFNNFPRCSFYFIKHIKYKNVLKFVKTKFIVSGSVLNNFQNFNNTKENVKYDIMYISHFRKNNTFNGIQNMMLMESTHTGMFYIVKKIEEFSKKYGKKFCIAMTGYRKDKKKYDNILQEEKNFFLSASPSFKSEDIESYKLASKAKLIVSTYSTLGLELLSMGKKVLFLDPLHFTELNYINQFSNNKLNGFHWYSGSNKKKIFNLMNRLLKMPEKKWQLKVKSSPFLLNYDKGNTTLKKTILKILKKN